MRQLIEYYSDILDDEALRTMGELPDQVGMLIENQRRFTYVNSWHMSDYESMAMWKIYGGQRKSSVRYDGVKSGG